MQTPSNKEERVAGLLARSLARSITLIDARSLTILQVLLSCACGRHLFVVCANVFIMHHASCSRCWASCLYNLCAQQQQQQLRTMGAACGHRTWASAANRNSNNNGRRCAVPEAQVLRIDPLAFGQIESRAMSNNSSSKCLTRARALSQSHQRAYRVVVIERPTQLALVCCVLAPSTRRLGRCGGYICEPHQLCVRVCRSYHTCRARTRISRWQQRRAR